ncbi:SDR family oxidoreductase [Nocardiopsis kunsanensis]|uniref:Thioester reductase (TE) domain-containing protein n=1 Tax=Nocardiopsis kunsanensis TaxID=141693 RepID=A0A918XJX7_9ACTN|nr:SDR family oxidoreductase [Nocardiopsis kunsanensis]GHD35672.1 hypothetical protein GCM10007147_42330 [Nocardiopsis kunsanensis]
MIHLVTGATGFLGSRLILELLGQGPDHKVVALARDARGVSAQDRVLAQLREAVEKYEFPGIGTDLESRVTVVAGDFASLPDLPAKIDSAWHTAASLKFLDRDAEEIYSANVEAVENLVAWLRTHGAAELNHVSTAYVAGEAEGIISEDAFDPAIPANNYYEHSKRLGEDVVLKSGIPSRIMRPSVVVGDSTTYQTMSSAGFYGFYRSVNSFKKRVSVKLGDLFSNTPVNLITNPEARADFVTVDGCVRGMVAAGLGGADLGTVTHLTNPGGTTMGEMLDTVFFGLGLKTPNFVSSEGQLSSIDRELSEKIEFYAPYIKQAKEFEHGSAQISELTTHPISRVDLEKFLSAFSQWAGIPHSPGASHSNI